MQVFHKTITMFSFTTAQQLICASSMLSALKQVYPYAAMFCITIPSSPPPPPPLRPPPLQISE